MNISIVVSNNTNTQNHHIPHAYCSLVVLNLKKWSWSLARSSFSDWFFCRLTLAGWAWFNWILTRWNCGSRPVEYQQCYSAWTRERWSLYLPLSLQTHPPVLSSASEYTPAPADCFPRTANVSEELASTLWYCDKTVLKMPCFKKYNKLPVYNIFFI